MVITLLMQQDIKEWLVRLDDKAPSAEASEGQPLVIATMTLRNLERAVEKGWRIRLAVQAWDAHKDDPVIQKLIRDSLQTN